MTQIDTPTAPAPAPVAQPAKPDIGGFYRGTGRRKAAIARVRIRPASGEIKPRYVVNNREVTTFFTQLRDQSDAVAPLKATDTENKFEVIAHVAGGGYTGQAGAVRLGLSRALKNYDPALEPTLRQEDFLTRDDRRVERKKPGQPGARKRFQFSKR